MTVYMESEVAQAARSWAALDAAVDDDWRDLFDSPSVLEYRRLWSLPPSGTRH